MSSALPGGVFRRCLGVVFARGGWFPGKGFPRQACEMGISHERRIGSSVLVKIGLHPWLSAVAVDFLRRNNRSLTVAARFITGLYRVAKRRERWAWKTSGAERVTA